MQGYIFYPLRGILFGLSNDFSHFHAPSPSLPSLPDRARSTDSQPQAARFLISPNFWGLSCSRHLRIPFWGESVSFGMEIHLSLAFLFNGSFIKVHEGFCYTNHLCSKSVLALRARVSTQFVKCFCQEFVLRHLLHRPGNFLHSRKFLCFFPLFGESLHFLSGHFWPRFFPSVY